MNKLRTIYILLINIIIHFLLMFNRRVSLGKNVAFYKSPYLFIHKNAMLVLGNNVRINSDNHLYHVNMYQRCKLMADRKNAIIKIGDNSRIHGSCIHAQQSITIGKNCLIAANCQIMDNNGHSISLDKPEDRLNIRDTSKPIVIEDNVWISTGVIVLPGVTIGQGSVIGANSVVSMDIPKNSIAKGNPIEIVKRKNENNDTSRL